MDKITLTKIDIAQRQLNTAVRLFFAQADCVSIETLVGASAEILRQLGKKHGLRGILHDSDIIKEEHRKDWIDSLRKPRNFFKHSGNDPYQSIEFRPKSLMFMMLEACQLKCRLEKLHPNQEASKEAWVFQLWFSFTYPEYLIDPKKIQDFIPVGVNLKEMTDLSNYCEYLGSPKHL